MRLQALWAAHGLVLSAALAQADVFFERFPTATPGAQTLVSALARDGASAVVIESQNPGGDFESLRWTRDRGLVALPRFAPGGSTGYLGISVDGQTLVGWHTDPARPVRLVGSVVQPLGPADSILTDRYARAVSANGMIAAGGGTLLDSSRVILWPTPETEVVLPSPASASFAGLSASGTRVAGTLLLDAGARACYWEDGQDPFPLSPDVGLVSVARAISSDGSTIVGSTLSGGDPLFRWTQTEGFVMLDPGPIIGSTHYIFPTAVSGDGQVIVGFIGDNGIDAAFYWDLRVGCRLLSDVLEEGGLDVSQFELGRDGLVLISDDGLTIAGELRDGSERQGFVARVPAPGTGVIVAIILGIAHPRRRR